MKKTLFVIPLFLSITVGAQVHGILLDSASGRPIDKAIAAMIIKGSNKDTLYTLSNEKGMFSFERVPGTSFTVLSTNIGYKPVLKFISLPASTKNVNLGNIMLINDTKVLGEVVVQSAPITIKEDTIEYHADAFKVKENALVEDLLKKLPGVTVDKDGNIKAQGKNVTKVRVNGKDFFGGDPKTATRELPANIIDKVQVIDDYGDQATVSGIKDGNPEKVINLQLKKDKNRGYFGRVTAGIGDKERYQGSLNGNYFNDNQQISLFSNSNNTNQSLFNFGGANGGAGGRGMGSMIKMGQGIMNDMGGSGTIVNAVNNGDQQFLQSSPSNDGITTTNSIGINYRDQLSKKVSVYGSYSYSHRNNGGMKLISQQNFNTNLLNRQNSDFNNLSENHRFYFNLEYNIDSFNYLKVSPNVTYNAANNTILTNFDFIANNSKTIDGFNNNNTKSSSPNVSGTILYNHRFHKRGRNISLSMSGGNSVNNYNENYVSLSNRYIAPVISLNTSLFNAQENDNHNSGIRLTYSEPLSKTRSLDLVASHNFNYTRNNKKVYAIDPVSGMQTFNPFLSNDYENDYYNDRFNASVRTTQKKYNYTVGLSFQPVDLRGISLTKDSAYKPIQRLNVFPIARFAYNFTKTKSINVNYSGSAQQPSFTQLQDIVDPSNAPYFSKGNPNLKPSVFHTVNMFFNNFNFITGKVIFTNLSVNIIKNQIVNKVTSLDSAGTQLSIPENVDGYYNINGFYNYSKPYKNRRYVLTLNGTINYNHNINLFDSYHTFGNNWIVNQGFNVEWNHKSWLEFGLGVNYSLNSNRYNALPAQSKLQNSSYDAWSFNSNINIDIPGNWVIKYDFDYTINNGLSGNVGIDPAILNASIEKQLFKKKNGIVKLQGFDLFNQNTNINRNVTSYAIVDSRTSRLNRYFLLSFTYRIQKFRGKRPQQKGLGSLMEMRSNG